MVAAVNEVDAPTEVASTPTGMPTRMYGPDGRLITKQDLRPSAMRCDLCGRRPDTPDLDPASVQSVQGPGVKDQAGNTFHIMIVCSECLEQLRMVLRAAMGIMRPESDLTPMLRIEAPDERSPDPSGPSPH